MPRRKAALFHPEFGMSRIIWVIIRVTGRAEIQIRQVRSTSSPIRTSHCCSSVQVREMVWIEVERMPLPK
jgi:hypothetical protein